MSGSLSVQSLTANLYDASSLDLNGTTVNYKLNGSGSSKASDYTFGCDYLDATLSDASEARLFVHKEIEITGSGASTLYYEGEAVITSQSLSGASSVVKVD